MEKILKKTSFSRWVKKLKSFEIYAPVLNEDVWNYVLIEDPEKLKLEYLNTVQSPKMVIFPQREVFLEFCNAQEEGMETKEVLPEEKQSVIFGVRPCDAKALTLTDKVFEGDYKDPYYWKRRNQVIIIGLTCNTPPSPNCFCTSLGGSPHSTEGMDILMTDIDDAYYMESYSKKGDQLIISAKEFFEEPNATNNKALKKIKSESEIKIKRQIKDLRHIPSKLKGMFDSPFWDEESMSCIRCGICTYLCPTCHCFDITDEVFTLSPLKGKRVRTWDTCQFPDFTMHSSGHNPRPDKASRLRQRVMHKFQYFVENFKTYQCTGCGRCISKCPVGIDILEVLNKVKDDGA